MLECQLFAAVSILLTENLEPGLAGDYGHTVDRAVDLIVFASVEGEHVVILRKRVNKGAGRRNYDIVLAVAVLVEDSVLIEIVGSGSRVALDKPHCKCELICLV